MARGMWTTGTLVALVALAGCVGTIVGPAAGGDDGDDDAPPAPDASGSNGGPTAPPGAADAAPAPSPDAAPGASACANALFCEDFVAFAAGAAPTSDRWTNVVENGSLTVDTTQARGARALHVHAAGGGRAYLQIAPFAPPGNSFYGRAFVYVTAFPSAPAFAHFTHVEAAGQGGGVVRPLGGQFVPAPTAGTSLWGVGADGGATGDWTDWQTTTPAESGRWQCLEWQLDAADNAMHVWIDGVDRPELSASTKDHGGNQVDFVFPGFTSVWVGWWLYQGGTSPAEFDLWYDDLVLATARVGCD
jgi:hypothetical protein